MSFTEGNIYLSKAANGAKFVYRCVQAGEVCEFVNLVTFGKHLFFNDTEDFFFVHEDSALFRHDIRDAELIGEDVDVY